MSKASLRETMPQTAAFIDECREVFGAEMVNDAIRLSMQGAQTFYAVENGVEFGTRMPSFEDSPGITLDKMVIRDKAEIEINNRRRK